MLRAAHSGMFSNQVLTMVGFSSPIWCGGFRKSSVQSIGAICKDSYIGVSSYRQASSCLILLQRYQTPQLRLDARCTHTTHRFRLLCSSSPSKSRRKSTNRQAILPRSLRDMWLYIPWNSTGPRGSSCSARDGRRRRTYEVRRIEGNWRLWCWNRLVEFGCHALRNGLWCCPVFRQWH